MAEHRQPKGRLGDEQIAGHHLERRAGRVRPALIIPRHHRPRPARLDHDLRRAEHMPGGNQRHRHIADLPGVTIFQRLDLPKRPAPIPRLSDRRRLRRRKQDLRSRTAMVAMAMGHHRPGNRLNRIDMKITGRAIQTASVNRQ